MGFVGRGEEPMKAVEQGRPWAWKRAHSRACLSEAEFSAEMLAKASPRDGLQLYCQPYQPCDYGKGPAHLRTSSSVKHIERPVDSS